MEEREETWLMPGKNSNIIVQDWCMQQGEEFNVRVQRVLGYELSYGSFYLVDGPGDCQETLEPWKDWRRKGRSK